jgi:hypothetical protein
MNKILDDYVNQQNAKPGEINLVASISSDMEFSRYDCAGVAVLLAFFAVCWLSIGVSIGWLIWS